MRIVWALGWIAVAFWSLFAFAAYGLVEVMGGAAMRHADMFSADPETVEWIFRAFSWVRGASTSLILIGWGLVSLAILSVPWILDRLARAAGPPEPPRAYRGPNGGVIDLAPGDYTIRSDARDRSGAGGPQTGGGPGPVPRIVRNG